MQTILKKTVSYLLIVLVLLFTVIGLLGVWDIIYLEDIVPKIIGSMLILFASSAVVLFIFTVLLKDNSEE
jgi:hypothetical protein